MMPEKISDIKRKNRASSTNESNSSTIEKKRKRKSLSSEPNKKAKTSHNKLEEVEQEKHSLLEASKEATKIETKYPEGKYKHAKIRSATLYMSPVTRLQNIREINSAKEEIDNTELDNSKNKINTIIEQELSKFKSELETQLKKPLNVKQTLDTTEAKALGFAKEISLVALNSFEIRLSDINQAIGNYSRELKARIETINKNTSINKEEKKVAILQTKKEMREKLILKLKEFNDDNLEPSNEQLKVLLNGFNYHNKSNQLNDLKNEINRMLKSVNAAYNKLFKIIQNNSQTQVIKSEIPHLMSKETKVPEALMDLNNKFIVAYKENKLAEALSYGFELYKALIKYKSNDTNKFTILFDIAIKIEYIIDKIFVQVKNKIHQEYNIVDLGNLYFDDIHTNSNENEIDYIKNISQIEMSDHERSSFNEKKKDSSELTNLKLNKDNFTLYRNINARIFTEVMSDAEREEYISFIMNNYINQDIQFIVENLSVDNNKNLLELDFDNECENTQQNEKQNTQPVSNKIKTIIEIDSSLSNNQKYEPMEMEGDQIDTTKNSDEISIKNISIANDKNVEKLHWVKRNSNKWSYYNKHTTKISLTEFRNKTESEVKVLNGLLKDSSIIIPRIVNPPEDATCCKITVANELLIKCLKKKDSSGPLISGNLEQIIINAEQQREVGFYNFSMLTSTYNSLNHSYENIRLSFEFYDKTPSDPTAKKIPSTIPDASVPVYASHHLFVKHQTNKNSELISTVNTNTKLLEIDTKQETIRWIERKNLKNKNTLDFNKVKTKKSLNEFRMENEIELGDDFKGLVMKSSTIFPRIINPPKEANYCKIIIVNEAEFGGKNDINGSSTLISGNIEKICMINTTQQREVGFYNLKLLTTTYNKTTKGQSYLVLAFKFYDQDPNNAEAKEIPSTLPQSPIYVYSRREQLIGNHKKSDSSLAESNVNTVGNNVIPANSNANIITNISNNNLTTTSTPMGSIPMSVKNGGNRDVVIINRTNSKLRNPVNYSDRNTCEKIVGSLGLVRNSSVYYPRVIKPPQGAKFAVVSLKNPGQIRRNANLADNEILLTGNIVKIEDPGKNQKPEADFCKLQVKVGSYTEGVSYDHYAEFQFEFTFYDSYPINNPFCKQIESDIPIIPLKVFVSTKQLSLALSKEDERAAARRSKKLKSVKVIDTMEEETPAPKEREKMEEDMPVQSTLKNPFSTQSQVSTVPVGTHPNALFTPQRQLTDSANPTPNSEEKKELK